MLLLEVRNQVFGLLEASEIISEKDFEKINVINDKGLDFTRGLILAVLHQFEQMGIVTRVEASKKEIYWVRTNPLDSFEQTLIIPGPEGAYIAATLNNIHELMGHDGCVDATRIQLDDLIFAFDWLREVLKTGKDRIEELLRKMKEQQEG